MGFEELELLMRVLVRSKLLATVVATPSLEAVVVKIYRLSALG